MQKMINQILEGNFDYGNGSLDFSCAKIEITLRQGDSYEGSFRILAPEGQFTSGYCLSSDLRMECLTKEFIGCEEEIAFVFHGEMLEEDEVVKGNFQIISNQGEYYLPFLVTVERRMMDSSIGTIKNLFHFANLARSNWKEAVKLFYSAEFASIFQGSDAQYLESYRALSVIRGKEWNVEEFLIEINKKKRVEFLVEEPRILMDIPTSVENFQLMEREIVITRNGWGYTRLFVECEGEFLLAQKEVLTDDDFLGNTCRLQVFVDASICREGKNFGKITLSNPNACIEIPVTVTAGEDRLRSGVSLAVKRDVVQLTEFYLSYRMKKMPKAMWLKETNKLVERRLAQDENKISARLIQAHLLITQERMNEAGWILDHVAELFEKGQGDDSLLAYYDYLMTLIHPEPQFVRKVADEVEYLYGTDNTNWRIAWLLLYLSENYQKSVTGKWVFLEKQFTYGCTSPVIYLEAMTILNHNPALLRRLGSFELQLLKFGVKYDILAPEVVEQLLYLVPRMREYSRVLFGILADLYQKKPDVRILQEICTLLIKGGRTGEKCLLWYQEGIEKQLRITNLYEYYMMSLNLDETVELPKMVLMYFSYQNNLDYERSAYLYDYCLRHEDALGELSAKYRGRMEYFCVEQILKRHINRHLANLYTNLLTPGMMTAEVCEALSELLFANQIRTDSTRYRKVYVYQPGNLTPKEYALIGGKAWVSIYGNDSTLVFEDIWKNRTISDVDYTLEKMMVPGRFLRQITPLVRSNFALDLYLFKNPGAARDGEEETHRLERIRDAGACEPKLKRELSLKLLQGYFDSDNLTALDEELNTISAEGFSQEERSLLMRFLVQRGNWAKAAAWLEELGPYFVDAKTLVRLLGYLLENPEKAPGVQEEILTAACVYVFGKGKADSRVLKFLDENYRGSTKSMRDIWKAARAMQLECFTLTENMLVQMLFSGGFVGEKMDIYRYYRTLGAKPEIEQAFLSQCAYEYFAKDRIVEKDIFERIFEVHQENQDVPRVCKLAYLKYYAETKSERTDAVLSLADIFLEEFLAKGIHLEMFRAYQSNPRVLLEMADKTIVECHAAPRTKITIHYVVLKDNGETDEYATDLMQEVYGGVCFKDFVLFFGETLQYYITEERDGREQLTESGTLEKSDIYRDDVESRFRSLNEIVISSTLEDYDTLDDLLEEYLRKDFLGEKLFALR